MCSVEMIVGMKCNDQKREIGGADMG